MYKTPQREATAGGNNEEQQHVNANANTNANSNAHANADADADAVITLILDEGDDNDAARAFEISLIQVGADANDDADTCDGVQRRPNGLHASRRGASGHTSTLKLAVGKSGAEMTPKRNW